MTGGSHNGDNARDATKLLPELATTHKVQASTIRLDSGVF